MSVLENLNDIHRRIEKASHYAEREPQAVQLVAVSKVQPENRVQEALEAGHRLFGENRVQEAQQRWAESGWRDSYEGLKLHLIGPLQTNKVKEAVSLFDVIETVDREKLARALAKEMDKQGRQLPCFIQVNIGGEQQKAGISTVELPEFYKFCVDECGLNIVGLMCIPPVDEPPALHFALLSKLAKELGLKELSMGMSGDFEQAIPLGATYVRVGSAIFGERDYS